MSNNIDNFKVKKIENLIIPLKAFSDGVREGWKPNIHLIGMEETGIQIKLNGGGEGFDTFSGLLGISPEREEELTVPLLKLINDFFDGKMERASLYQYALDLCKTHEEELLVIAATAAMEEKGMWKKGRFGPDGNLKKQKSFDHSNGKLTEAIGISMKRAQFLKKEVEKASEKYKGLKPSQIIETAINSSNSPEEIGFVCILPYLSTLS